MMKDLIGLGLGIVFGSTFLYLFTSGVLHSIDISFEGQCIISILMGLLVYGRFAFESKED